MNNNLLFDAQPIVISAELAVTLGLNESIVLQQVHYWLENNRKANRNFHEGKYWTYNTYEQWQEQFPFWSLRTVKTVFAKLESQRLLITGNFNKLKFDRTKWYTIDYDNLNIITPKSVNQAPPLCRSCTMDSVNVALTIPEINTETNDNNVKRYNGVKNEFLHSMNKNVLEFIRWYFDHYKSTYGCEHPHLKKAQFQRVHDTLLQWWEQAYGVPDTDTVEAYQDMALSFFDSVESDHNINHFATPGILEMRAFETLL